MKKKIDVPDDPLDRELDFTNARPNPYFVQYQGAKVIRVLEPDLAELFPDNASVNAALRAMAELSAQMEKIRARAASRGKKARKAHS